MLCVACVVGINYDGQQTVLLFDRRSFGLARLEQEVGVWEMRGHLPEACIPRLECLHW